MHEPEARLIDQANAVAELLEQAQRGYAQGLDANRALLRQGARRSSPAPRGWLLVGAVAAAAALIVTRPWQLLTSTGGLLVTAEKPSAKPTQPEARAVEKAVAPETQSRKPEPRASHVSPTPLPATHEPPERKPTPPSSSAPIASAASPAATEEDCLAYARAGDPRRAAACFSARAGGSGLSAQVALYELSRLQRDALGEPAAALSSLTSYLERFPNGSLNGEARFSRLELLARLGRMPEALSASTEFLRSRAGQERAAEVHLFRGNLLLSGGSAAAAAAEYRAALGAPGRVGDDAAYRLAVALESSGARADARAAYERYLERPGGRHRAAASAKLTELSP
jgi:tetratricopeptide (TPR) repeat protein